MQGGAEEPSRPPSPAAPRLPPGPRRGDAALVSARSAGEPRGAATWRQQRFAGGDGGGRSLEDLIRLFLVLRDAGEGLLRAGAAVRAGLWVRAEWSGLLPAPPRLPASHSTNLRCLREARGAGEAAEPLRERFGDVSGQSCAHIGPQPSVPPGSPKRGPKLHSRSSVPGSGVRSPRLSCAALSAVLGPRTQPEPRPRPHCQNITFPRAARGSCRTQRALLASASVRSYLSPVRDKALWCRERPSALPWGRWMSGYTRRSLHCSGARKEGGGGQRTPRQHDSTRPLPAGVPCPICPPHHLLPPHFQAPHPPQPPPLQTLLLWL